MRVLDQRSFDLNVYIPLSLDQRAFDLNLYIPLSKVDENMRRAHAKSAASQATFWFRKHMAPPAEGECEGGDCDACEEMTAAEILTGKGTYFPGLLPLTYAYL